MDRSKVGCLTLTKAPAPVRLAKQGKLAMLLTDTKFPRFGTFAQCTDSEPDLFFDESSASISQAKSLCQGCPVIKQCAEWALRYEEFGVFGGLSAKERKMIRGTSELQDPNEIERARQDLNFILQASASEVALRFGVDTRTVVRWRNILRPVKEVS
jgi:hypothetical protein